MQLPSLVAMECTQVLSEIAGGGADALAIASADSRVGPARAGPMENLLPQGGRDRPAGTGLRELLRERCGPSAPGTSVLRPPEAGTPVLFAVKP